jgi:hypothetical protein
LFSVEVGGAYALATASAGPHGLSMPRLGEELLKPLQFAGLDTSRDV